MYTSSGFRGGLSGLLEHPSGTQLFQFHGEIMKNYVKCRKTKPLLMDLNSPSRNSGSVPGTPTAEIQYNAILGVQDTYRVISETESKLFSTINRRRRHYKVVRL